MHGPISTNGILAVLGADGLGLLKPHLTGITLDKHHRLADAGQPMARAYFPTSGIASVVTGIRNDAPIEVGLIGREGFVGAPIAMGVGSTPSETYMQVAGHGWHIAAGPLSEAVEASASLRAVLLRFAHVFMVQMASTVLANGHATLPERLARWLLMAHDRVEGDSMPLTHALLSIMLGVRRAGVTTTLREFERRGLVLRYRARIDILDRQGLVVLANGYYGTAGAEYRRVIGRNELPH